MVGPSWCHDGNAWHVTRMSPFICYHVTARRNRSSIRELGLLAARPRGGGNVERQPYGVYAFSPDLRNFDSAPVEWCWWDGLDCWQIAHIGPMRPDPLVRNGIILSRVTDVTLVTGND